MADSTNSRPPHYRWNYIAFAVEASSFYLAVAFAGASSIIPAFARQLTSSEPLIGLTATIYYGGFYLPQLFTARLIGDRPRKKPFAGTCPRPSCSSTRTRRTRATRAGMCCADLMPGLVCPVSPPAMS